MKQLRKVAALLILLSAFLSVKISAQPTQYYVQIDSITDGTLTVLMRDTATGDFPVPILHWHLFAL